MRRSRPCNRRAAAVDELITTHFGAFGFDSKQSQPSRERRYFYCLRYIRPSSDS